MKLDIYTIFPRSHIILIFIHVNWGVSMWICTEPVRDPF